MPVPVIVAGEPRHGVWCPACNEPVRVRVPLHIGHLQAPVAAYLEVCALCGHSYIPALPVVALVPQTHPWWHRRPRPVLAAAWRVHRRLAARDHRPAAGCALGACPRPGWHACCWFQRTDDGVIRWVFCGRRHRRQWLREQTGSG